MAFVLSRVASENYIKSYIFDNCIKSPIALNDMCKLFYKFKSSGISSSSQIENLSYNSLKSTKPGAWSQGHQFATITQDKTLDNSFDFATDTFEADTISLNSSITDEQFFQNEDTETDKNSHLLSNMETCGVVSKITNQPKVLLTNGELRYLEKLLYMELQRRIKLYTLQPNSQEDILYNITSDKEGKKFIVQVPIAAGKVKDYFRLYCSSEVFDDKSVISVSNKPLFVNYQLLISQLSCLQKVSGDSGHVIEQLIETILFLPYIL